MKIHMLSFALFISLTGVSAATCYGPNDEVSFDAVLTTKTQTIEQGGVDGIELNTIIYDVAILNEPICYEGEAEGEDGPLKVKFQTHIVQLMGSKVDGISADVKTEGLKIRNVKGKLFTSHTRYHFQKLLMNPESLSVDL